MERVEVVGEAGDGRHALKLIQELTPDVVLLDLQMPGLSGFEVLQETTEKFPDVKIVVLSVHDTEEYALRALRSGAAGYLPKSAASAELELAIDQVIVENNIFHQSLRKWLRSDPPEVAIRGGQRR